MEAGTDLDSVTDLLALRLSSVPFHDIERAGTEERMNEGEEKEEARFPSETLASERWLPQLATVSFVGPITPIQPALGFFSTKIPLLLPDSSHPFKPSGSFPTGLLLLPSSLVVGTLPQNPLLPCGPSNWLISGEICLINKEITVVAQSVYEQQPPQAGLQPSATTSPASQVSFTGYMNRLIRVDPPVWTYTHTGQTKKKKRDYSSLEGAMEAILAHQEEHDGYEEVGWQDGDEIQDGEVRLAELEWLDLSVHLQSLTYTPPDHQQASSWSTPSSELVSFKCRPANKSNTLDSRLVRYGFTLPLVGQLVAIQLLDPSSDSSLSSDQNTCFFIQL
ncbi:hypothetical protein PGTUg99_033762 [Puccinia graminis f. sp. tritici]|uniref:Uncharacterized protein n=1 Tax=Puccinia graminis f. sp. tritici TaxID=56615 RepID=A0A5B0RUX5_PUCGR|nr:hypothetical protein PGTUg99_033762 [Puccinia graminis f. sp. tritici]